MRRVKPAPRIRGDLVVPGDKSISHRAAILGALAEGETTLDNFLTAEDCLNTLAACRHLGTSIVRRDSRVTLLGKGLGGLKAPTETIDCGNSGTGVRLLAGVLAGQPFTSVITGDEQVRRRPMQRIIDPLTKMGAHIQGEEGGFCPLHIRGGRLRGIDYESPISSAQVKSCVLLAGLFASGTTRVHEPARSRDHTERLLAYFRAGGHGGDAAPPAAGATAALVTGGEKLVGRALRIPGDISSAAFFVVAAALRPGSDLYLKNIGVNPTRTGLLEILASMGAVISREHERLEGNEPVADLRVTGQAALRPITLDQPDVIPTVIDEIPILAVAATAVQGEVVIRRAQELRVKETDRIGVLAAEYRKIGIKVRELPDGLVITGGPIRGGEADSHGDHRLAMSLAVAGLLSEQGVSIDHSDCVKTSFPNFWELLDQVSA